MIVDPLQVSPFTGTSAFFWAGVVLAVSLGTAALIASVVRFVHINGISMY